VAIEFTAELLQGDWVEYLVYHDTAVVLQCADHCLGLVIDLKVLQAWHIAP
jgi:hypothetical protein